MSSQRRINASRANGALSRGPATVPGKLAALANSARSTGPRTPEGKARSARNALRHGILAESIVLDSESSEAFCEILATLELELKPTSFIERRFVENMATAEWRRLRLLCIEKDQFLTEARRFENDDARSPAGLPLASEAVAETETSEISSVHYTALAFKAMADQSRAQELLNRYESRYDRQYNRALAALRAHRAEKRLAERDVRTTERARKRARKARLRMRARRRAQKIENEKSETN